MKDIPGFYLFLDVCLSVSVRVCVCVRLCVCVSLAVCLCVPNASLGEDIVFQPQGSVKPWCLVQADLRRSMVEDCCVLSLGPSRYGPHPHELCPVPWDGEIHPGLLLPGSPPVDVQTQPGLFSALQHS